MSGRTLQESWESLEEAQDKAARRRALSVAAIPTKVEELHGQFVFDGYVARSRTITCDCCEALRTETLGVYARELHSSGGVRYTLAHDWPQGDKMRHEIERTREPYCFSCIQQLGFTEMEDLGERRYMPQERLIERGIKPSTNRIIPKSAAEVLTKLRERPSRREDLDVQEMLDELSDGTAKE